MKCNAAPNSIGCGIAPPPLYLPSYLSEQRFLPERKRIRLMAWPDSNVNDLRAHAIAGGPISSSVARLLDEICFSENSRGTVRDRVN